MADNSSCPRCGHYNAIIDLGGHAGCRDCGYVVLAPTASPRLRRMEALEDAYTILNNAMIQIASGSDAVWKKVNRAKTHVNQQIADLLVMDDEEVVKI